jgi:hypothetical protein
MNSGKISQNRNRTKSPRRKAPRKKPQTKILSHFISTDPKDCELLPSLVFSRHCHLPSQDYRFATGNFLCTATYLLRTIVRPQGIF